jgi:hypothetical protein
MEVIFFLIVLSCIGITLKAGLDSVREETNRRVSNHDVKDSTEEQP